MQTHSVFLVFWLIQAWRKGERNRELESVQHPGMAAKDSVEQKSLHEFPEKEPDQAFRGEFAAQTRLSEAQAVLNRRELGEAKMLTIRRFRQEKQSFSGRSCKDLP